MLCERCNKKKVSVFYRENIGGRIKALRLCGECAEILERAGELEDVSAAIAGFVSPLLTWEDSLFSLPFPPVSSVQGTSSRRKCSVCGTTAEEISQTGKIGCAACYGLFSSELTPIIYATQGKSEHAGRQSAGYRARMRKTERLAALKQQLKHAVQSEQYEAAVGLRDEIRALEAEL